MNAQRQSVPVLQFTHAVVSPVHARPQSVSCPAPAYLARVANYFCSVRARWLFRCDRWPFSIGSNTDHVLRLKERTKRHKSDTDNNYVHKCNYTVIYFVSYECETRLLTVHKLTVSENTEVWRIYGLETEGGGTGEWRKL